jgi:sporulation protein YlmC with PRC-barrel domain
MDANQFEDSRVAQGTISGAQKPNGGGDIVDESSSISRDDARDGVENAPGEPASQRYRRVLSADTLAGDRVHNSAGEDLGSIEEIMLDIPSGRIAYAVLSFGGFLGIGNKLFAVPWDAMRLDEGEQQFILDVDRQTLESAPGFDKGNWPDMADPAFGREIHAHYGTKPYWGHDVTDAGDYTGENLQRNKSIEYEPTVGYNAGENNRPDR